VIAGLLVIALLHWEAEVRSFYSSHLIHQGERNNRDQIPVFTITGVKSQFLLISEGTGV
jgi:uncharacterized protein (UPF0248 family)